MRDTITTTAIRRCALAGGLSLGLALPVAADMFHPEATLPGEKRELPLLSTHPSRMLPKLSTLGQGLEYRYAHSDRVGVRFERYQREEVRDGARGLLQTQFQFKLLSHSVLFDWFPFEGNFRATVGVHLSRSEIGGSADFGAMQIDGGTVSAATINGWAREGAAMLRDAGYGDYAREVELFAATNDRSVTFDGGTVPLHEYAVVSGRVRLRPVAPYLGVGWANDQERSAGLFYSIDVGLIDLGRPRVDYRLGGLLFEAMQAHYGAELEAWVAEEERQAEAKLSKYRYFPVVSFGLGYRF